MKRKRIAHILLAGLITLAAFPAVHAQSFSSFILSGKASDLATGDLAFRTPDLAQSKMRAEISFGKWMPRQLDYSAFQAGTFLALGTHFGIRLDYRNNLFEAFEVINKNGNVKGSVRPSEQRILAGISLRLADNLLIDVNGKYLMADLDDNKATAFAGDVAVSYVKDRLTIGLKGADIGSKYDFGASGYSLPMRVLAGASYCLAPDEKQTVTLGADLGYILPQDYQAFTASVGGEYAFRQLFFARAGYHFSSAVAPRFAAFGLGVAFKGIGLDAACLIGRGTYAWTISLKVNLP